MEYDDRGYGNAPYDDADDYRQRSYDDAPPRAPRKKKKRSKFSRFMRALKKYLAQMPAQSFIIIGGSIAVVLVAVILLIVLLPGGKNKAAEQETMGELSLADMTPTPSLAPTEVPTPSPEPEPTPDPDPLAGYSIATIGERHDAIPAIQQRLVDLGYMDMPVGGVTDLFGPATKNAIRRFQMRNIDDYKLWDGQIGADTYNLLMADDAKGFFYKKGDTDDSLYIDKIDGVLQPGLVTKLQNRIIELGYLAVGAATGTYGTETIAAIKLFQQYHGLTPIDGLAGQSTLKLLYSAEAMDAITGAANDRSKITPAPGTSPSALPDAAAPATTTDAAAAAPAA